MVVKYTNVVFETDESVLFREVSLWSGSTGYITYHTNCTVLFKTRCIVLTLNIGVANF